MVIEPLLSKLKTKIAKIRLTSVKTFLLKKMPSHAKMWQTTLFFSAY